MNDTIKFHGVNEATFPAIMRRSLVENLKGRIMTAGRLACIPADGGYFLVDLDTKDFVTSRSAAGALLTVIMGHMDRHPVSDLRQRIEDYANEGGDGGLT